MRHLMILIMTFLIGMFVNTSNIHSSESLQIQESVMIVVSDVNDIADAVFCQVIEEVQAYHSNQLYIFWDNHSVIPHFVDDS